MRKLTGTRAASEEFPARTRATLFFHRSRGRHVRLDPPPLSRPSRLGFKRQNPRVQVAYSFYKTLKFVAFLTLRPDGGFDDDYLAAKFSTPVGTAWAVSSIKMSMQDLGLPVLGDVTCQIVRRRNLADPTVPMASIKTRKQVPMGHLVWQVDAGLQLGWDVLSTHRAIRRSGIYVTNAEPLPNMRSVSDELAKAGKLPPGNLDLDSLPTPTHDKLKTLSEPRLKRALTLLAHAVHFGKTQPGGACCDLDDPLGPVCLGGVLPSSPGLKMFMEAAGDSSQIKTLNLSPYHVLAVRGYAPAGHCVNLSVVCPKTAFKLAARSLPLTAALAAVLSVLKCMPQV